jgi:hypothetical protein
MHDIFVSYSRKDRELALPLLSALERQGFSVWWDFQLKTGEVFDSAMETALKEAQCCLVLWSRNSIFADWVRAEATKAKEREVLLPVLLEEVPIPAPFNILQTANFTTWSGILPFPEFDRLIASIKGILATGRLGNVMHEPLVREETAVPSYSDHLLATDAQLGPIRPLPYPPRVRSGVLRLRDALYRNSKAHINNIEKSGTIVFHAVGGTGNISATRERETVVRALLNDFDDPDAKNRPVFLFHLGDLVYNFGEAERYYDQFYDPFRNYPAPIFAIPGHHDGMVAGGPNRHGPPLQAFFTNFCASVPALLPLAGDVDRPAQIQPGVYWTLEAPFIRILGLYSNCLGGAGIISSQGGQYPEVSDVQISFLKSALTRIKKENYSGAVIVAVHHPPYCAAGLTVGCSPFISRKIAHVPLFEEYNRGGFGGRDCIPSKG